MTKITCRQTENLEPKNGNTMSMYENIIILCGHYGAEISVRDHFITKEISIGDYVLWWHIRVWFYRCFDPIPGVLE
jgi:tRNA (guanine-N1)-methyltransferase